MKQISLIKEGLFFCANPGFKSAVICGKAVNKRSQTCENVHLNEILKFEFHEKKVVISATQKFGMTEPATIPATGEWLFIVNPNAGVKKGSKDWPQICKIIKEEGLHGNCILTERRGHAIEITQEQIRAGYRKIAVVGGDGTLNEVLNGIMLQQTVAPAEISLGMIPVGTGNDWCRTFGVPMDYRKAVHVLKEGHTVLQDAGLVNYVKDGHPVTRYFMNVAGMGYDALVAKKTNLLKEKGRGGPFAYFYFIFASLFQFHFPDAVLEIDGKTVYDGKIFSMNVGICKYNGGGMKQVPAAIPDDGILDVVLIKKAPKYMVIRHASKLYDGTHIELPFISTYSGKSIKMTSPVNIYLETDGESMGHTPFRYEVLPRAITVVVPKDFTGFV
jgi:diacylglycerol kinase (ATP)